MSDYPLDGNDVAAASTHRASAAAMTAAALKSQLIHSNLSLESALALLEPNGRLSRERLAATLSDVRDGAVPRDSRALKYIAERFEHLYATPLGSEKIDTGLKLAVRRVGDLVGAVIGIAACYLIFGGLVEGKGGLLANKGALPALAAFLILAGVLAVVEALHVAGTQLRYLNLDGLADSYPRVVAVHKWIRSQSGIDSFLSGRQLIVICTVFLLAQLTSMPRLTTWPFTDVGLPDFVHFFVRLGLPGAFVLLWFSQLMPQFVATRRTLWLTNTRVAGLFVRIASVLDEIGLARFGHWAASLATLGAQEEPRIPLSPALRWTQVAEDDAGYAGLDVVRRVLLSPDSMSLQVRQGLAVRGDRVVSVVQTTTLAAPPRSLSATAYLLRGDDEHGLTIQQSLPATPSDGLRLLQLVAAPAVGSFQPNDEVRTTVNAEFAPEVATDAVYVDGAVRFLLWELELVGRPRAFPPLTLTTYVAGRSLEERMPVGESVYLEPVDTANGRVLVSHRVDFPTPNTLVVLSWEVDW
jgi:hypothetical protein